MKKLNLIIGALVLFILIAMTSCVAYPYGMSNGYDENDYYYIEGSPYYHQQHYYNDYYYDRSSSYYHSQHYYRDNNLETQHNNRSFVSHDRAVTQPQRRDRAVAQPQPDKRVVNNNRNAKAIDNSKNVKSTNTRKNRKNNVIQKDTKDKEKH